MEVVKRPEVIMFRCSRETYCLLREFAEARGLTVSNFCHCVLSDLVKPYRFLLCRDGGDLDG